MLSRFSPATVPPPNSRPKPEDKKQALEKPQVCQRLLLGTDGGRISEFRWAAKTGII